MRPLTGPCFFMFMAMNNTASDFYSQHFEVAGFIREVFGYMECEDGVDKAIAYQKASEVKARWDEYMKDILIRDIDPETGKPKLVRQIFLHK